MQHLIKLVLLLLILAGCKQAPSVEAKNLGESTPTEKFYVCVQNDSSIIPVVNFEIKVDGELVAKQYFPTEAKVFGISEGEVEIDSTAGHEVSAFLVNLEDGEHQIQVYSWNGGVKLEQSFDSTGMGHGMIRYHFSSKKDGPKVSWSVGEGLPQIW